MLVPLDGSLFAEAALETAIQLMSQLASSPQDELCLVRMVDDHSSHNAEMQRQARQEAERYLQAIRERLSNESRSGHPFSMTFQVSVGEDVAKTILQQAEDPGSLHLIVMATHGREGVQRLLLGSVAERVLGATTSPLLLVCPKSAATRPAKPGQLAAGKI